MSLAPTSPDEPTDRPIVGSERRVSTSARVTIAYCAFVFVVGLFDHAGMAPCGASLFGALGALVLLAWHVVSLPFRWRTDWRGAVLSIVVCVLLLPAIKIAAPYALLARFRWFEADYERVADGIRRGTHVESLAPHERSLGYWVQAEGSESLNGGARDAPESVGAPVVVVHFLAVGHGYAGHVGFARAFDAASEARLRRRHGFGVWRHSKPLGNGWFLVAD